MNDTLYYQLIQPWVPFKYLPTLVNRQCSEYTGMKRCLVYKPMFHLYADIYCHTGSPCYRYCICHFFSHGDKTFAMTGITLDEN